MSSELDDNVPILIVHEAGTTFRTGWPRRDSVDRFLPPEPADLTTGLHVRLLLPPFPGLSVHTGAVRSSPSPGRTPGRAIFEDAPMTCGVIDDLDGVLQVLDFLQRCRQVVLDDLLLEVTASDFDMTTILRFC